MRTAEVVDQLIIGSARGSPCHPEPLFEDLRVRLGLSERPGDLAGSHVRSQDPGGFRVVP